MGLTGDNKGSNGMPSIPSNTKNATDAMLTPALWLSWKLMNAGDFAKDHADRWGADDHARAGFSEVTVLRLSEALQSAGERLEAVANRVAMWLGYEDGELSGIVAWPDPAH
jgi:hypothetical protein